MDPSPPPTTSFQVPIRGRRSRPATRENSPQTSVHSDHETATILPHHPLREEQLSMAPIQSSSSSDAVSEKGSSEGERITSIPGGSDSTDDAPIPFKRRKMATSVPSTPDVTSSPPDGTQTCEVYTRPSIANNNPLIARTNSVRNLMDIDIPLSIVTASRVPETNITSGSQTSPVQVTSPARTLRSSNIPAPHRPRVGPLSAYNCPICFSPPSFATLTPCGHICCGECLFSAVKSSFERGALHGPAAQQAKCPVCRAPIPDWDGKGGGVIGLRPRVLQPGPNK
ncbi:hypothetical protein BDY19DRAFT_939055 [Irpex rosettiformis]|uniref:Uncharacterized protein n=1 Tax=Irpex rosettiformis TaxID=378272 RepID=A0ACB8U7B5_9APHY|nr:hypothetical protein BDY19DRAFT_939055 [Irpex rosettiformis]